MENNIGNGYDSADEARILGDDEYPQEGKKPALENDELNIDQVDDAVTAAIRKTLKPLLDLLTPEQLEYVESSGLLTAPGEEIIRILEQMIAENGNKQKLGV